MTFVDKPWGNELIWSVTDAYAAKVITIDAGKRLSLQYHERKTESILVIEGRLLLHLADDAGEIQVHTLEPGDHAHVPAGRVHRFEADLDTRLVEVSTPELDDVVRIEDDFGREGTSAP
ncbi:MAG TPA: cupin domain-containing protein [Acidimicrobiia bacterium]|nr:cupin domain-containing protein [Acidimicrobiia bacterium]